MPLRRARFLSRLRAVATCGAGLLACAAVVALVRMQQPVAAKGESWGRGVENRTEQPHTNPDAFDTAWHAVSALPEGPARDEALRAFLTNLPLCEIQRALDAILSERNTAARESALNLLLRRWAELDAPKAAGWALRCSFEARGAAFQSVLEGVAHEPELAVALTQEAIRVDPVLAHDHGCALVFALAGRGAFSVATEFALNAPEAEKSAWLGAVFDLWARRDASAAASAALALANVEQQHEMLLGVIAQWATSNPLSATVFANALPAGPVRRSAMDAALTTWVQQDVARASAWIDQQPSSENFDGAVVSVAISPILAQRRPLISLSWAESVVNPELRSHALASVLQTWAQTDPTSAAAYLVRSPDVKVTDREMLLATLVLAPR